MLVISPGDDIPSQVVCLDTPINIVFSGVDDDSGEGNEGFLSEITQGSSSLFAAPLNGIQTKFYDEASRVSQTMLSLLVGKSNGYTRDDYGLPLSPRSRRLCFYLVDNTFTMYGRYGDWPHTGYSSVMSCFELTFVGPPEFLGVFVGEMSYMHWPPLESSFEFNLVSRNESAWPVLSVGLGRRVVISFIAADSNIFDTISFLVREDPGLPSSSSSLLPVKCIPRIGFDPRFPGGSGISPCSLAVASVEWSILLDQLPSSALHGNFSVQLCLIARDSSTSCTATSPAATSAGWYSTPSCALLRVVVPALSWSASAMRAHVPYPVISVGFDCSFVLFATLINNASVPTDVPVNITLAGNASQLLVGSVHVEAKLDQELQHWDVQATLRVSAAHQGLSFTACFDAESNGLPNSRQRVCSTISVKVCSVCTHPGSSLYTMAVSYYSSSDWQPLVRFNSICTPDRLCIANSSALPVSSDLTMSSDSGGVVVPVMAIGAAVAAQSGYTAATLARLWNTSESLVRRLNPSRIEGTEVDWCVAHDVREDE